MLYNIPEVEGMVRGKKLFQSILLLLFSILLLITTTLAWFSFGVNSEVDSLITSVGKYQIDISIEVSHNHQGYQLVKTEAEMAQLFNNTVPGDIYDFRLNFTNSGSNNVIIDVAFDSIENIPYNDDVNMLEVFFINNTRLSELVDKGNSLLLCQNFFIKKDETKSVTFRLKYDENTSDIKYQKGKIKIKSIMVYINSEG